MARKSVRCTCGSRAEWDKETKLYLCPNSECRMFYDEEHAAELGLTGRIRGPEDVPGRLSECLAAAADNPYLGAFDLQVYAVYVDVAQEHNWIEVMAADRWVAEQLGVHVSKVTRARNRLENFGHAKRRRPKDVKSYALRRFIAERRLNVTGGRFPVIVELRVGNNDQTCCSVCGGSLPDGSRVSRRTCSNACRVAAQRQEEPVTAS